MTQTSHIMRTDDIGSRCRRDDRHAVCHVAVLNVLEQAIILGAGGSKWIEEHNIHVLQLPFSHVLGSLLQALSPIDIRIVQQRRSSCGAAGHFVEVGNIVRESRYTRPGVPRNECRQYYRSRSRSQKFWDDATHPDENKREYRKNIANSDLIGENRRGYKKKSDGDQQDHLAPAVNKASGCVDGSHNNKYHNGKRCLEGESKQEVIPPAPRLQLSEQIERIIFQMIGVDETHVSKVQERRGGKQISCFNHQQASRGHDEKAFYLLTHKTEAGEDNRQQRAGEFDRHCSTQRQSSRKVAQPGRLFSAFPKQVKRQNAENRHWNIRGNEHSMCEEIRTERVKRHREYARRGAEQITSPQKSNGCPERRDEHHHRAGPEQQAVRVISVKKLEGECVLDRSLPVLFRCIEAGMKRQERQRSEQFCQRRMLRVHSKISCLPVAVSGREVDRLIRSRRQPAYGEQRLKTKYAYQSYGCDV